MAISLINSSNVGDNATLQLGGASYVTTAVVGDTTYVFVTGKGGGDNAVSVFSLGDDGTLTNVFNVADNNTTNLGGAFALTTAVVGDTTYLFVCGVNDSGVSVFSVGADGSLTNTANVGDSATLQLSLSVDVETMVVGGTTYLFADGVNDNGVSVFAVGANGTLTNVDNVIDNATSNIQGPQGMATAVVGGNAYLFVTGYHDDGVGVYSVAADGHLTNVFNVRDSGQMELDGPVDAITVVVGGTTYLVVSGFDDDGLTVFSVAADGHLTNVFNLPDDGTLKLDNPVGLSTTVIGGTTYLLVAGAEDDGLSVFAMGADGALTNVANVSDDATLKLDRVIGVTTVTMNGQTYVIAGSNNDSGVSVFKLIDDTNHEPTLIATGNNPDFTEGGTPADIYSAPLASTADSGQTFTSLTLTVTNVTDGANEILSFLGHDLALTDGNSVAGATVSLAGTTATVTFPGAADAAALQALVDGLAYRNASENPTEADRVITITQLTDSGGTAGSGDDTAALDIVSTVHVHRSNDAAIISGDTGGTVTEAGSVGNGTPTAAGNLDSTDVDNPSDAWSVVAPGAGTIGGFGTYAVTADGQWTYTLDNANAAVQALNGAATLTDTFNAVTADGTAQLVTITIHAQNDAAVITGDAAGAVTRSAGVIATDSRDLNAADVDDTADAWQAVAAGAATANGYGTYQLTAAGVWTYTLDSNNAAVQALKATDTLTDTFTALTADGTAQIVTVTISAHNDASAIDLNGAGPGTGSAVTFTEGGAPTPIVDVSPTIIDANDPQLQSATIVLTDAQAGDVLSVDDLSAFGIASAIDTGVAGRITVTLTGASTLANYRAALKHVTFSNTGETPSAADRHIEVSVNDGQLPSNTAIATVTVTPVNDAPVAQNGASGGNEDNVIHGALIATDVDSAVLTYSRVAQAAHGTVTINANGTFSYTPNADFHGVDSFSFKANDGFADSNVATVNITVAPVNDAPVIDSNGGGNTAAVSVSENKTAVTTVHATDVDSAGLTYSIVGGSDAGKFHIDATTGVLSFITAPDFESPADADHNNSYIVNVRASDGSLFDDQAITVAVTNANEASPTVHWTASVDVGAHPAGWLPGGIGDFNGDAVSDLAWFNATTGNVDIWKLSNGHWAGSSDVGNHPMGYRPAGFGDFNADGTSDVLWFNATTRDAEVWKIANGQWAGSVDIGTHPAGWQPAGAGDFNGDGTSDVLWYNAATGNAEVWKIADGKWAGSVDVGSHPAGYQPSLTGDFNGDGTSDIGWYNATTGDLDIWTMSNGQWAGSVSAGSHPAGWQPLGAGDFNGDGTSDIAWYNPANNNIDIWLIDNSRWAGSFDVGSHPAGSVAVGVGDFDHNGVADIMWRDTTTGHIENWLLAYS
jgi:VCBS repeat-containing protein